MSMQVWGKQRSSVGRYSSVGRANGYGLDDPGFDSLWGARFSIAVHNTLRLTQPPVQVTPVFPGG